MPIASCNKRTKEQLHSRKYRQC